MTHPTPPMPTAETPAAARADVAGDTPLLPCPFCGGRALSYRVDPRLGFWRVTCTLCDAAPSMSLSEAESMERVAAWAAEQETSEAL